MPRAISSHPGTLHFTTELIMTEFPRTERLMESQSAASRSRFAQTKPSLTILAGLTVLYLIASKLGLLLAILHPSATAVWPGTGIALAAMLLLGYQVWPAIFLGAFAVNLTTAGSVLSSLGIATGNTLEALLGSYLVIRFANGRRVFDRAEYIFRFALFACLLATTVSASFGTVSLFLTGFTRGVSKESIWLTWWLGNMAGAILVTPCFLLWPTQTQAGGSRRPLVWRAAALASLFTMGLIVFGGSSLPGASAYPLKFLCIPFVVWVAFELRPREAALATLAFSIVVIASVIRSMRGTPIPNESLLVIQLFLSVVAMTNLLVSTTVFERNRNQENLRMAKDELEQRVVERTRELEERVERQERAEQTLRGLSGRLLQVQDEERRRIARDLHDSTGQSLTALLMKLAEVNNDLEKLDSELSSQLASSQAIAKSIADEVRMTSYLLHPPLLDEMGLRSALNGYIEGFKQRSNVEVTLTWCEGLERLPRDVETMIFRIVQEGLTNIHRHSGSRTASISLSQSIGKLIIEIKDHGKGISSDKLLEVAESRTTGVGLRGMRERLRGFGGELEILSDSDGTLVRATIPYTASDSVRRE
jgi:signal transduction histidine kinase